MDIQNQKDIARTAIMEGTGWTLRPAYLIENYAHFRQQGIPIVPSAVMANYVAVEGRVIDLKIKQAHILALYNMIKEELKDETVSAFIARSLARTEIPFGTDPKLEPWGRLAVEQFRTLEGMLD